MSRPQRYLDRYDYDLALSADGSINPAWATATANPKELNDTDPHPF